ncbi:sensor histidine kinase [Amycolatopsis cynarae]|uniref:Sensor histidine kinase n=1 Tax=Amycolatopsis cynarae TaxID=2995223 RepID=A0ABY7AZH2_9PSEU|nr:sensor histidine kinase [Amycolatopsis sp. HUAS 11-8]WAL63998.1 sensor histidine kinase [Amycolatopsis sp. HUAS 11-8]
MVGERGRESGIGLWSDNPPGPWGKRGANVRWPLLGLLFYLPVLIPTVRNVAAGDLTVWRAVLAIALTIVYGAGYIVFPWLLFRPRPLAHRVSFCAVMLLLGWLMLLLLPGGTVYLLIYSAAVISFGLPPVWTLVLGGTSLAAAVVLVALQPGDHGSPGDLGAVIGVSSALFSIGRLIATVRSLRAANQEIATLAVTAERERLARDLHDILGHSLTTITVKAGLARRVLETGNDPERAVTEIREVEGLARSALSDVRATVSDYREVSLSAELVGAKAALRAADIEAELPQAVDNVRPELQQTFGYVLREAVTNVLRHARARQVKVRFGRTWLEIEDDGVGGVGAAPDASGNGLRGLAERLAAVGGTLHAQQRPGGGFLVRAEVKPALEVAS